MGQPMQAGRATRRPFRWGDGIKDTQGGVKEFFVAQLAPQGDLKLGRLSVHIRRHKILDFSGGIKHTMFYEFSVARPS